MNALKTQTPEQGNFAQAPVRYAPTQSAPQNVHHARSLVNEASHANVLVTFATMPRVNHAGKHARHTVAWNSFVRQLSDSKACADKSGVELYSPFSFRNDVRSAEYAESAGFVVLDFDGSDSNHPNRLDTTSNELRATFGCFDGLLHSSHSYEPGKHKFRVVLRLSRAVNALEYKRVYRFLIRLIGENRHDPTAERCIQFFYFPSHKPSVTPVFERFEGLALDVSTILETVPDEEREIAVPSGVTSKAFRALGELGHPMRPAKGKDGGWYIACPWHTSHTSDKPFEEDTSTLLFESGGFSCKHAHCIDKTKQDVEEWLHDNHPEVWNHAQPGSVRTLVPATGVHDSPELHAASDVEPLIRELFRCGSDNAVSFLSITPGSGKTKCGLDHLRSFVQEKIARVTYSSPRHDLNREVVSNHIVGKDGFAEGSVHHPISITHGDDCKKKKVALRLAGAPVAAASVLCGACEFCTDYDGSGTKCPAFERAQDTEALRKRPFQIRTHATLALDLRRAEPGEVVFIDEQPALTLDVALTKTRISALESSARYFTELQAEALREVAESLRGALDSGAERMSLRSILLGGSSLQLGIPELEREAPSSRAARLIQSLNQIREGFAGGSGTLRKALARDAYRGTSGGWEALGEAFTLLMVLCEAACSPLEPVFFRHSERRSPSGKVEAAASTYLTARAPFLRGVKEAQERGVAVIFASATLDAEELERAIWGEDVRMGVDHPVLDVHIQSAAAVKRACLTPRSLTRTGTIIDGKPNRKNLKAFVAEAVAKYREFMPEVRGTTLVIATFKPIAEDISAQLAKDFCHAAYAPLQALQLDGAYVEVCYYGGLSGIDRFKDADGIVMLGIPIPNFDAVSREATLLGVEPAELAARRATQELIQAEGRIRAVHRTKPCLILHCPHNKAPIDLKRMPQWRGVVVPNADARSHRHSPATKQEVLKLLDFGMNPEKIMIKLQTEAGIFVSRSTIYEWSGERSAPQPKSPVSSCPTPIYIVEPSLLESEPSETEKTGSSVDFAPAPGSKLSTEQIKALVFEGETLRAAEARLRALGYTVSRSTIARALKGSPRAGTTPQAIEMPTLTHDNIPLRKCTSLPVLSSSNDNFDEEEIAYRDAERAAIQWCDGIIADAA